MKKTEGSFTIEATLSLFFFIMMMLLFQSIARYVTYQSKIKHSLNQTALEMSVRNYTLSEIGKDIVNLFGTGTSMQEISELLNKMYLSREAKNIAKEGAPYSSGQWDNKDIEMEALRYLASEYLNISLDDVSKYDKEKILKEFETNNIKQLKISGGFSGSYLKKTEKSKVNKKMASVTGDVYELYIIVEYRVNTGLNLLPIFGGAIEPSFKDSVKIPLMQ